MRKAKFQHWEDAYHAHSMLLRSGFFAVMLMDYLDRTWEVSW